MTSSLPRDNFKKKGDKIKFEETITVENTKLIGKWSLQADDDEWTEFNILKVTKQN